MNYSTRSISARRKKPQHSPYCQHTVGMTKKASKAEAMKMFMKEKGPLGMKDRMGCIESIQFRKVKDCWDLV